MTYLRTHFRGARAAYAALATLAGVWLRATLENVPAVRRRPARAQLTVDVWRQVWARREEWRRGYPPIE